MIRVLFFADTHLGIDLPVRPRIQRRRRGHDFFANFQRVLDDALELEVDLVVHGGDLLYRSRVPPSLVQQAFSPLKRVAEAGLPVYLVPGNHERSHIPHAMLGLHPRIHIFHRARTFVTDRNGVRVGLSGFPYVRDGVRGRFREVVEQTEWRDSDADIRLLCIHHCVEGATVGPSDYVFRGASDVVRTADLPAGFAAVLSGHIHRHQVLTSDLRGQALPTPVLYPGSIERTSFAEKDERKGYLLLELACGDVPGGALQRWEFRPLPVRPMILKELNGDAARDGTLVSTVRRAIEETPDDAVLKLRIFGTVDVESREQLRASRIRALAPSSMNVDIVLVDERQRRSKSGRNE